MTTWKKLASCLFAVVLGASLAFVPMAAFAVDDTMPDKGIADQFSTFEESEDGEESESTEDVAATEEATEETESAGEDATAEEDSVEEGNEGVVAGENAEGDWMNESAPTNYVFDEYGLFSTDQVSYLEQQAKSLAEQYGMGVYFLTTDLMDGNYNPTADERTRFATKYYMDHSLGLGSNKDGIMFVVAVDSRDYVTIAYGQGSYSFSNGGISSMEDAVTDYLGDDDWYGAAEAYYESIGGQLAYYAQHGEPGEPLTMFDYLIRFGLIILLPLIIAFAIVGGWKSAMKTAQEKNEASDYLDESSLVLTQSSDQFINSSVIATPRASESKGGGGGGWGGGGGGGFSSSGGGKF